jgi:molybdenum cofactor biosynthesis enzyme MoaA
MENLKTAPRIVYKYLERVCFLTNKVSLPRTPQNKIINFIDFFKETGNNLSFLERFRIIETEEQKDNFFQELSNILKKEIVVFCIEDHSEKEYFPQ